MLFLAILLCLSTRTCGFAPSVASKANVSRSSICLQKVAPPLLNHRIAWFTDMTRVVSQHLSGSFAAFLFTTVKFNELRSRARSLINDSSRKISVRRQAFKAHPPSPGTHVSTTALCCFIHIFPI